MAETMKIKLKVNGRDVDVASEGERSLLEVLREDLLLTGTKYGCGEGACGACSVLVDGRKLFSCSTPVSQVAGKSITTIIPEDRLHEEPMILARLRRGEGTAANWGGRCRSMA